MSLTGKHVLIPHCAGAGLLTDLVVQIKLQEFFQDAAQSPAAISV